MILFVSRAKHRTPRIIFFPKNDLNLNIYFSNFTTKNQNSWNLEHFIVFLINNILENGDKSTQRALRNGNIWMVDTESYISVKKL